METARVDGRTLRYQHRRPELLAQATEYVLDHGLGDTSLRTLAQGLGVTHATLLRHFSSREELLIQVIRKIHADFLAELGNDDEIRSAATTTDYLRATWRRLCIPAEQRQFVLLFEVVGRAARDPGRTGQLVRALIDDWLAPLEERLIQDGCPADLVAPTATLILGQVRGLQLDLIMTGDQARVDRALDLTIAALTSWKVS